MRVIAGRHRGLTLASVGKGDQAAHLRPTTDRVRENLFNILVKYGQPKGRVLDLFAGTGGLGIEALSRGAESAVFVDNGRRALDLLKHNIGLLRREGDAVVIAIDTASLPVNKGAACDLILLDPPYGKNLGAPALTRARENGWIAEGAIIAWEDECAQEPPHGFDLLDHRTYGNSTLTFLENSNR